MKSLVRVAPSRLVVPTVVAVLSLLLAACGSVDGGTEEPAGPVALEVETQDWTGWSREQPEPRTRTVRVVVGETIEVEALGDTLSFAVTDFDEDRVFLSRDEAWSPRSDGGGIDLTSTETEFKVTGSEPLEVSTPTTDGGTTVRIFLV